MFNKKILTLSLMGLLLVSCGSKNDNNGNGNGDDGNDQKTLSWRSEDLEDLTSALGDGNSIPFPEGFTEDYQNSSYLGTDEIFYFNVSDSVGDLTQSYKKQLSSEGFYFLLTESDESSIYTYLSKSEEDVSTDVILTYTEETKIFEINANSYSNSGLDFNFDYDFPYSRIKEALELDKLDDTILPSYDNKGRAYYSYQSSETYMIGSYVEYGTETDFEDEYTASLESLGYKIDSSNYDNHGYIATSEEKALQVVYYGYEGTFNIMISKYEPISTGNAQILIDSSDFAKGYPLNEESFQKDGASFKFSSVMDAGNSVLQFRKYSEENGYSYIYNDQALTSSLVSIVVTADSKSGFNYYSVLSLYVANSVISDTSNAIEIIPTQDSASLTVQYNVSVVGNFSYFCLINESSTYASKNSSISINLA